MSQDDLFIILLAKLNLLIYMKKSFLYKIIKYFFIILYFIFFKKFVYQLLRSQH